MRVASPSGRPSIPRTDHLPRNLAGRGLASSKPGGHGLASKTRYRTIALLDDLYAAEVGRHPPASATSACYCPHWLYRSRLIGRGTLPRLTASVAALSLADIGHGPSSARTTNPNPNTSPTHSLMTLESRPTDGQRLPRQCKQHGRLSRGPGISRSPGRINAWGNDRALG